MYVVDLRLENGGEVTHLSPQAFSLGSSVGDLYTSNVMIDVVNKRLNPQLRKCSIRMLFWT